MLQYLLVWLITRANSPKLESAVCAPDIGDQDSVLLVLNNSDADQCMMQLRCKILPDRCTCACLIAALGAEEVSCSLVVYA